MWKRRRRDGPPESPRKANSKEDPYFEALERAGRRLAPLARLGAPMPVPELGTLVSRPGEEVSFEVLEQ